MITKQNALEMALLLNASGEMRSYLVGIINRAFGEKTQLELNGLCYRLEYLAKNDSAESLTGLLHYILCLRLEFVDPKMM